MSLRRYTGGTAHLQVEFSTVGECLVELERLFPELAAVTRDADGQLLAALGLYVNGEDVRYLAALETPLEPEDELTILLPVAGGERSQ